MIKLEKQNGIATVTLSRAKKQNALSFEMFVELNKAIKNIKRDNKYDFFIVRNIYVINDVYVLLEKIEFQLINFFLIPAEYHQDSDTKVTYIQERI